MGRALDGVPVGVPMRVRDAVIVRVLLDERVTVRVELAVRVRVGVIVRLTFI